MAWARSEESDEFESGAEFALPLILLSFFWGLDHFSGEVSSSVCLREGIAWSVAEPFWTHTVWHSDDSELMVGGCYWQFWSGRGLGFEPNPIQNPQIGGAHFL